MKFYHFTYENVWEEIQKEGVLWGRPSGWENYTGDEEVVIGKKKVEPSETERRYTYLSPDLDWSSFGGVLLEVEYEPFGVSNKDEEGNAIDNFAWDEEHSDKGYCWQFSVFKPIPLSNVNRVYIDEAMKNFDKDEMYKAMNESNKVIRNKMENNCKNGMCDMLNQTRPQLIPEDGSKLGMGFFTQKNSNPEKEGAYHGRKYEKIKVEDISYDDTVNKGEEGDYVGFLWVPYGVEIAWAGGVKAVCEPGMFDE